MINAVESIRRPDPTLFEYKTRGRSYPLIILEELSSWRATGKWNLQYFRDNFGQLEVSVCHSPDGIFRGDPETGFATILDRMTIARFSDLIGGKARSGSKYYLAQQPLAGDLTPLMSEVEIPAQMQPRELKACNLWIGPSGVISPLHYDLADNFLCQVTGSKRIILFSPEDSQYMYPYPQNSRVPHMSQVNLDDPDLTRCPNFPLARRMDVQLSEGEMLFIPLRWWHQVHSTSFSISVNFWH